MCDVCCAARAAEAAPNPVRFSWSTQKPRAQRRPRLANNLHAPPHDRALPAEGTVSILVEVDPNLELPHATGPLHAERGAGSVRFSFPERPGTTRWYTYGRPGDDFMDLAQAMSHAGVDMTWDFLSPKEQQAVLAQDAAQLEAVWASQQRVAVLLDLIEPARARGMRRPETALNAARSVLLKLRVLLEDPLAPEEMQELIRHIAAAWAPVKRTKRQAKALRRLRAMFKRVARKAEPTTEPPQQLEPQE